MMKRSSCAVQKVLEHGLICESYGLAVIFTTLDGGFSPELQQNYLEMRRLLLACVAFAWMTTGYAQTFVGTNAPGGVADYSIQVGVGVTNVAITLNGDSTAYSSLLLRRGVTPTETSYDFASLDARRGNALFLENPELSTGTWHIRIKTPATSASHRYQLVVQTNRTDLRSPSTPVTKPLNTQFSSLIQGGSNQFFRVQFPTNTMWRISLDSTNASGPDLYVQRDQTPTPSSYLKKASGGTNDSIAFNSVEGLAGVYYIGVFGASAPTDGTEYTLRVAPVIPIILSWDPGTEDTGTLGYTNLSGIAGDYYFKIVTANPSAGAWRTALRLLGTNDANVYLSKGTLPTPALADFKSERQGADGMVLGLTTQFLPSEDWYILVRAKANAPFALVSGAPFVTDLGTVAADGSSGSGPMQIGPEGIRFFRTSTTADMLAWRLYLDGGTNPILVRRSTVPLENAKEQSQFGQMLMVPPALTVGQYYLGIPGAPGSIVNLDSRPQHVQTLNFGETITSNNLGYGYSTYRVVVPSAQLAWQMYLPSTNGNPNFAVRRNFVPNEGYNDAYSDLMGTNTVDNITLVPPVLSDGTFYITVYCTNTITTNSHHFVLQNGPAVVTDIDYLTTITNDDPERVGWRYYRVADIRQQTNSLCWTMLLSNSVPGTRIALRRNAAPSIWNFRDPNPLVKTYYDRLSLGSFLQDPDHQSDIYYIGIYSPSNRMGRFVLTTQSTQPQPLVDNVAQTRTNIENGRWEFFSVELTEADVRGDNAPGPILGLEIRLQNVTSGMPRLVMRRELLPTSFNSTVQQIATTWTSGQQLAAGADWTKRSWNVDGTINEDGRILSLGVGRPLQPGKYYIGVVNQATTTNEMSYQILSRWIGPGRSIPVTPLVWNGGKATNSVGPREAKYYQVVIPANTPSWKVQLTPKNGEAMLVAATNRVPSCEMDKRVQKPAKEHYVQLPPSSMATLIAGTNYLVVVGEGQSPTADNRIGDRPTDFVLESVGTMPEIDLGFLLGPELSTNGYVEAGESIAFHFTTLPTTMGFYLRLEDTIGNPVMVSHAGADLPDPGYGGDYYGNDGGATANSVASNYRIIWDGAARDQTVIVKSRQLGTNWYNSSFTLKVVQILPGSLAFDGGTATIQTDASEYGSFYKVEVPEDAMGWDLRLTNVLSGNPRIVVRLEALPIKLQTADFNSDPSTMSFWPVGAQWFPGTDWTGRPESAVGTNETGRLLAMGRGRPLQPGLYTIAVIGNGYEPVSATLVSRGIGETRSIPVKDLNFTNGTDTVTGLPPREAKYYRVLVPTNTPSWKVHLQNLTGENMMAVLFDTLPNIGTLQDRSAINSAGRRMNRIGNENFVMLPPEGGTQLLAGYYYIAVVGEGEASTNLLSRVGPNTSSYTIRSVGIAPVVQLGTVSSTELVRAGSLEGGETQIYEFTVPAGVQSMELRLEDRTGNPVMTLRPGPNVPSPGASSSSGVQLDYYGNEGGEKALDANSSFISLANPTNGTYRLTVKARSLGSSVFFSNATYTLRIAATDYVALDFDQGVSVVENQVPTTWRYFRVNIPANAAGWDLRLTDVKGGIPRMVVRRETLPDALTTTSGWNSPGTTYSWPTNSQYAPAQDWTKRTYTTDGLASEDGRILAFGLNRPLQPGTYYVGVRGYSSSTNMSYTLRSRGIGSPYSIPVYELPFVGSHTNLGLMPRQAAYYRVVIPTNAPSWRVKLTNLAGESMLAVLRNALPNADTVNATGDSTSGKGLQKPGNEHFVVLPKNGTTNIQSATNFLAVISEGKNPPTGRIGSGSSDYTLSSFGPLPITDMGLLTSEDLAKPETLEDGEVKAYQFEVPYGTYGFQVMLEGRSGNPVAAVIAGTQLPDPGSSGSGQAQDYYGNEGGYQAGYQNTPPYVDVHSNIVTVANPTPGMFSLVVKGRVQGGSYQNAAFTLRVKEVLVPELNFAGDQNTNGLSNEVTGLLQNNERAFFKFIVPATNNGQPVIGWKLDLIASSGNPSMRVCRNVLPSDKDSSTLMDFATGTAIIAPPYLTNGVWFVEVKGAGSSAFTLRSNPLELQRPPWVMPGPLDPVQTPGVQPPDFADSSVATNGAPLPPGGILLEQGSLHYYAIEVPATNAGLLQMTLEALDGNPDLYLRGGSVPTLSHRDNGASGSIYERSMTSVTNTEYANWVPLDGKLEALLKPGLWYLAVKAAGNTQAKYRLTASNGDITDLPIHGSALVSQEVRPGNWKYYRVMMPSSLPLAFNVTFSQQSGDVVLHIRDTVPPGNGVSTLATPRDWYSDNKNYPPYSSYDAPNTYTFTTPQVRPGQPIYLGFRAPVQATFNVQVTTNGAPTQEPVVVSFYGGSGNTVLAPYGTAVFRVDVPPEATRWKHIAAHVANVTAMLDQGSVPNRNQRVWMSSSANSAHNALLVGSWDPATKQYNAGTWPWVPGQPYFMVVTNGTATAQEFTLTMDGRNAETDDNDNDGLPDHWEYVCFGHMSYNAEADSDGDTRSNLEEYQQSTNPGDASSYHARVLTSAARGTIMRTPDLPSYELGSTVTLTPVPSPGYSFIGWSGSVTSSANPLVLTIDGHKNLVATFKLAGDDFVTALPLAGGSASVVRTNLGFTKESGEPFHAGNPGGKSIWWRWVAPASGDFTLSTAGTPFNTLMAVYTGTTVSSLTHIASDNNSLGDTNRSNVKLKASQGTTYYIAVDGYNGASGRIQLSLAGSVSIPDTILGPPQVLPNGLVRFNLSAIPNRNYQVQYSTNLATWYNLGTVTASGSGNVTVEDQSAPGQKLRFYRAMGQ